MAKPLTVTRQRSGVDDLILGDQIATADWFWPRLVGLMGQKGLKSGGGLLLKGCPQVHTCFMGFAMDAVFIDKAGIVLAVSFAMKPWRLSAYVKKAYAVLELEAFTRQDLDVGVGDRLVFA
jgi:uncharacterized membrane protein (UPF0127 family)